MNRKTDEQKAKTLEARRVRSRAKAREKWAIGKAKNAQWFLRKKKQNVETCQRRILFRPEHKKKVNAAWRLKNLEHVRAVSREWKRRNPEKHKAYVLKAQLKYAQTPKGRARAIKASNIRTRRLNGVFCDWLRVEKYMQEIISSCPVSCTWCSRQLNSKTICFDHVVPITKGGQHVPENLTPSCKSCNSSKGNKLLNKWIKRPRIQLGTAGSPFGWSPAKEVEYNRYWGRIPWNTPIPEGERTTRIVSPEEYERLIAA